MKRERDMTDLEIGKVYTMGRTRNGDRSYCSTLWRVLGKTDEHVVVISMEAQRQPDDFWHGAPKLLMIDEHSFQPAGALVDILYPELLIPNAHEDGP